MTARAAAPLPAPPPAPAASPDVLAAGRPSVRRVRRRGAAARGTPPVHGLVVGTLAGVDRRACPLVAFPGAPSALPVPARAVVPLAASHVGRAVALLFDGGDVRRPIVMGVLDAAPPAVAPEGDRDAEAPRGVTVHVDDERIELEAAREIVLRCGAASLTLTRAGKVLVKGEYVLTQARGVNRIRGGSVQIN